MLWDISTNFEALARHLLAAFNTAHSQIIEEKHELMV